MTGKIVLSSRKRGHSERYTENRAKELFRLDQARLQDHSQNLFQVDKKD